MDELNELKGQVAVLRIFAISLMDALPKEIYRAVGTTMQPHIRQLLQELTNSGQHDLANAIDCANEELSHRLPPSAY